MGGGVSLMEGAEGVEQLMTTALMIGRAISAVAFPGMYRIYDFHSKKAPKLKNGQKFTPFFNADSDDEDEEEYVEPNPANYEHFFHVKVGGDTIYIEDPLQENEAGWTALHACCMSLQTVEAGLEIIEEMSRRGGHFDTKTVSGPGTFNRGWTALQMACAYGVEPLVEKLVEMGADVNAVNSFGYSCMLEACHRGYIVVAKHLLQGRVDLAYIPDEELAANSPFASAPCQSALAEAARSGFFKVVQTLLDAGAPKDLGNRIGWTALHEACFYNRMETVKTLLLGGASATVRTKQGALPYHLACIPEIRNMLESMGGAEAVPTPGDTIDMLMILTELTMGDFNTATFQLLTGGDDDEEDDVLASSERHAATSSGTKTMASIKFEPHSSSAAQSKGAVSEDSEEKSAKAAHTTTSRGDRGVLSPMKEATIKTTGGVSREEAEGGGVQPALLHSGPLLGNLPAFGKNNASPKKFQTDIDHALLSNSAASHNGGIFGNPAGPGMKSPSKRADDKSGGKKKKKKAHDDVPKDTPVEFLCQLTQRPMSEPMKTIYGNVYDRTAIMNWLSTQGKICPLTGAPLSESDLTPNEELGNEIKRWIIMRSTTAANSTVSNSAAESATVAASGPANDDLYDF